MVIMIVLDFYRRAPRGVTLYAHRNIGCYFSSKISLHSTPTLVKLDQHPNSYDYSIDRCESH